MTTILEVLEKGAQFLTQKGIKDARLNMELMVAHELELKRMDLYLRFDQPIPEERLIKLRENLKKRGQRVPLQHITGITEFYRDSFKTDSRALIPRPETEELVQLIHKAEFPKPARILDLGCGSGVLGISIARALGPDCTELILADLSTEALSLAKENSERLEIPCELIESDLFSATTGTFDVIAANLPYVAESVRDELEPELQHDPAMALFSGADGLDCLRRFAKECSFHLNSGGLVALEVGFDQGEVVAQLLKSAGLIDVTVACDLNGIARFPLARKA
ncbi:peptide chain release factor N(5)-glutamine methyltransferase [Verrucomicrobiaceae bacterium 227]